MALLVAGALGGSVYAILAVDQAAGAVALLASLAAAYVLLVNRPQD